MIQMRKTAASPTNTPLKIIGKLYYQRGVCTIIFATISRRETMRRIRAAMRDHLLRGHSPIGRGGACKSDRTRGGN